jgi:hypothetical protein
VTNAFRTAESRTRARLVLALLTIGGAAARLHLYSQRRSLWIDEARLAINIASRSFADLARPLAFDQSAPLLFLWLERLTVSVGGVNEFTLRFVPLVAGVAAIPATYALGAGIGGRLAGATAVLLMALSPTLIRSSAEGKQYMVEALVTATTLGIYVQGLAKPSRARERLLTCVGMVAVWLSAPVAFVLASLCIADCMRQRDSRQGAVWLLRALLWLASFGGAYLLVYRHASSNPYLAHYWRPAFLAPIAGQVGAQYRAIMDSVLWGILLGGEPTRGPDTGAIVFVAAVTCTVAAVMLAGAVRAWDYRSGLGTWLLVGPAFLAALASLAKFYPLAARTALFAAPLFYCLAALGLEALLRRRWGYSGVVVGLLGVAVLLGIPVALSARYVAPREQVRPLVEVLEARRGPRDITYVSAGSLPAYAFYTTEWAAPDTARLRTLETVGAAGGEAFQNARSRGRPVGSMEGASLQWCCRHGRELFGVFTGIEAEAVLGASAMGPDAGWAAHEANRVHLAMNEGSAWVLLSHYHRSELSLIDELARRDSIVSVLQSGTNSVLVHVTARALAGARRGQQSDTLSP